MLGVPRLKEVINVAKNLKTPSMMIHLKGKKDSEGNVNLEYNADEILTLKGKMEYTSLLNIVSLSEIYYDPDIRHTIIKEDQEIIDEYFEIMGEDVENIKENISPWVLRLILDKNFLGVSINAIEEIIRKKLKLGDALIIHSTDSADEKKFHIRLKIDKTMSEEQQEKQMSLTILKNFEKQLLTEVKICGIDSIKKVYVRNSQKIEFDQETGKQKKNPKTKKGRKW